MALALNRTSSVALENIFTKVFVQAFAMGAQLAAARIKASSAPAQRPAAHAKPRALVHAPAQATAAPSAPARRTQNGVLEPPAKGACRTVWNTLDKKGARAHKLTIQDVRELAVRKGWSVNNTVIEYYRWKRFNG